MIITEIKAIGKMKNLLFIIFLTSTITIHSQQPLQCCCNKLFADDSLDIQNVLSDYVLSKQPNKNIIIMVDYLRQTDTLSIISIFESKTPFELFYKRPECYFIDNNRIVYIRTNDTIVNSDSMLLDKIFFETLKILYYSNEYFNKYYYEKNNKKNELSRNSYKICWKNDSIESLQGVIFNATNMSFDPTPVEYKIKNGKIISKRYVEKVLFPDVSYPKGVGDRQFRTLPYWKE